MYRHVICGLATAWLAAFSGMSAANDSSGATGVLHSPADARGAASGNAGGMKRVVIVGAGIVGLFCAVRLAKAGARVTVVEAESSDVSIWAPGASATMNATAAHSRFCPLDSTKMRPVSQSRETTTPRDWFNFNTSIKPAISVGRRCDWSSTNGLLRPSSSAAASETQVASSERARSV